jgi:hypothetical protein
MTWSVTLISSPADAVEFVDASFESVRGALRSRVRTVSAGDGSNLAFFAMIR